MYFFKPLQCVTVTSSRDRLDYVGGHLSNAVYMARCGVPAAFVRLCKPHAIEDLDKVFLAAIKYFRK